MTRRRRGGDYRKRRNDKKDRENDTERRGDKYISSPRGGTKRYRKMRRVKMSRRRW